MKNVLKAFSLILTFIVTLNISAIAQKGNDVIHQVSCFDADLKRQADSLKIAMYKDGFVVVKEATMSMESEYEMPVVVPLAQGSWYHFVFIGEKSTKLTEVRMYDYNEKQIVYEKAYGDDVTGNMIGFSYIPKFSEYHMIKPVQVNKKKKKDICGYILMFKKVK